MNCDCYVLEERNSIHFSADEDGVRCCCTFNSDEEPDVDRVRALAYLGAAIVLMQNNELEHGYLPSCLPDKIRYAIDRCLYDLE